MQRPGSKNEGSMSLCKSLLDKQGILVWLVYRLSERLGNTLKNKMDLREKQKPDHKEHSLYILLKNLGL